MDHIDSTRKRNVSGDIQVIDRCAQILRLFSPTQRTIRVAEVVAHTGMQRSTVHRYLASMSSAGMVQKSEDGGFRLGRLAVQIGAAALRGVRILEIVDPYLQSLSNDTDQTAVVSVWGSFGPVVTRVHEPVGRQINLSVRTGTQLPIEAAQTVTFLAFLQDRSIGERLLSQLPDFRRQALVQQIERTRIDGYIDRSEMIESVRALSAPVFDHTGTICATIAIIGIRNGDVGNAPQELTGPLVHTAQRLSRELGFHGNFPIRANRPMTPTTQIDPLSVTRGSYVSK